MHLFFQFISNHSQFFQNNFKSFYHYLTPNIFKLYNYFFMCFLRPKFNSTKVQSAHQTSQMLPCNQLQFNIHDFYDFQEDQNSDRILGFGGFSYVVKAVKKNSKQQFAIKIIQKKQIKKGSVMIENEDQILSQIKHKNIVEFIEKFETQEKIYLVLQYCQGGELFDLIQKCEKLKQNQAKKIMKQVAEAISYLHQKDYVHRDLKLNNLMFLNRKKNSPVKLIDFGCATKIKQSQLLTEKIGTVFYTAPEVLKGIYNQSCDIWSFGIILYIILYGYPPYYGQTETQIISMIEQSNYTYQINEDQQLSYEALDLISRCLTTPQNRIKSWQILVHPWFEKIMESPPTTIQSTYIFV